MARGPQRRGLRGCFFFFRATASCAYRDRACLKTCSPAGGGGSFSGWKYSVTRRAAWKIFVWMIWILMLSANGPLSGSEASRFLKAWDNSRRTDIHSVDTKLLC